MMPVHENVKYPCDQCDSKFTQKGDLKKHKLSVHKNVNPCDQHDKKATKSNLETHKIAIYEDPFINHN